MILPGPLAALVCVGLVQAAGGRDAKDVVTDQRLQAEIDLAIRQLGDNSWKVRAAADERLWTIGRAAEPALRAAAKSQDAEVAMRARGILEKFRWGIVPDAPKETRELIREYREADLETRAALIDRFRQRFDDPGLDALRGVRSGETEPHLKLSASEAFSETLVRDALSRLLQQSAADRAETLLREAALGPGVIVVGEGTDREAALRFDGTARAQRAYAAMLNVQGRLTDEFLADLEDRLTKADDHERRRIGLFLTAAWRIRARPKKALAAAERSENPHLRLAMLVEANEWEALRLMASDEKNRLAVAPKDQVLVEACCRLFIDGPPVPEDTTREIVAAAATGDSRAAAAWLVLNGQAVPAAKLLRESDWPIDAKELYDAALRYDESWAVMKESIETDCGQSGPDFDYFAVLALNTQAKIGAVDRVRQPLSRLAPRVDRGSFPDEAVFILEALRAAYMLDLRDETLGRLLGEVGDCPDAARYLAAAAACHGDVALAWWIVLRDADGDETVGKRLAKIEKLACAELPRGEMLALLAGADARVAELPDAEVRRLCCNGLAVTCRRYGLLDRAIEFQKRRAEVTPRYDGRGCAELLLADGRTAEAVEAYRRTCQHHPDDVVMLHRLGGLLMRGGQEALGRELHWRARLLDQLLTPWPPLTHALSWEDERDETLDVLLARVRAAEPMSRDWIYRARDAAAQLRRTGRLEEALALLQPCVVWTLLDDQPWAYDAARLAVELHATRALREIAAGRFDRAGEAINVLVLHSGHSTDQTIEVVRALDKAGRKDLADAVVRKSVAVRQQSLKELPRNAGELNNTAWLLARCRRKLDLAEECARRAQELSPWYENYRGTLAEVLFQRGKTAEAVEMARQTLVVVPDNGFFRRQLDRFRKGDPSTEPPPLP